MKYLTIAILLLITVSGMGQKKKYTSVWFDKSKPPAAYLPTNSDTLFINVPLQIHFIKIGTKVYQIVEHEPTLEEVKPKDSIFTIGRTPNMWYAPYDKNLEIRPN